MTANLSIATQVDRLLALSEVKDLLPELEFPMTVRELRSVLLRLVVNVPVPALSYKAIDGLLAEVGGFTQRLEVRWRKQPKLRAARVAAGPAEDPCDEWEVAFDSLGIDHLPARFDVNQLRGYYYRLAIEGGEQRPDTFLCRQLERHGFEVTQVTNWIAELIHVVYRDTPSRHSMPTYGPP